MTIPDGMKGLRFACECVSAGKGGYSDPWSAIAKNKLLPDGTKEEILNLLAREPKTISQLAKELKLKPASIHAHVNEMMASELLRESIEWEKKHPTERYYEPNFPVVRAEECEEFEDICQEMAEQVAALFEEKRTQLESAFARTEIAGRGWTFTDIAQCIYANVQRHARALLEERGALQKREKHANGAEWLFWAEETHGNSSQKK